MEYGKVLNKLNDILKHEWTGVAQYAQAGYLVSGLWRLPYSEKFFDSAKESFGHAKTIGEKITALGGVPSVERNPIKQATDVTELLKIGYEFETTAVRLYNEALALAEGDRALVILLEDILLEEQEGADEIAKLLKEQGVAVGNPADAAFAPRKSGRKTG
jgi:bacterioferritin